MSRLTLKAWASRIVTIAAFGIVAPIAAHAAFPPLNSPASPEHVQGKFIWADLFTSRPDVAASFYCKLLGWTVAPAEEKNRSYLVLSNGDHPVAGVVVRRKGAAEQTGVWVSYISVVDAKTALAGAVGAGAVEHAPVRDFPDRGMQAIVTDPEGSVIGLLQSSSGDASDSEPKPGDWNWFELYSVKIHTTSDFYKTAFGFEVAPDSRPGKDNHLILSESGRARAGIAPLPASPDSRSGWLGCVRVTDVDDAVSRVPGLGGTVLIPARPASLGSRFAVVADPTGSAIALIQYVDNANPANRP